MSIDQLSFCRSNYNMNEMPDELITPILSILPLQVLNSCSQVSSRFYRLANDSSLWKALLIQYSGSESVTLFSTLVEQNLLTWKEAFRLRPLLPLLSKLHARAVSEPKHVEERNPQVKKLKVYAQLDSYMHGYYLEPNWCFPQPVVVNNGVVFAVANCVQVVRMGRKKPIIKGESEALITHLAHDGKYLYARRFDGWIIKCNPKTGENRRIETSLSQDEEFRLAYQKDSIRGNSIARLDSVDQFFVKDGFIFNRYHNCAEIIEINSNRRQIIKDKESFTLPRCLIQDKKLYMVGDCIYVWNLETGKKEALINGDLSRLHLPSLINNHGEIFIGKDMIYMPRLEVKNHGNSFEFSTQLLRFNLRDGTEKKSLSFSQGSYAGCLVLGDLFFASNFDHHSKTDTRGISLFNLRTTEKIGEVVIFDQLGDYKPSALAELIALCKSNSTLLAPQDENFIKG